MSTETALATQVYEVSIRSTPEQIWDAITKPEWTAQYFHGARITVVPDHYSSLGPDGDTWGDADVEEFDPPRRLVHGWRSLYDPELALEEESRVTWDIVPQGDGTCLLRVTHDRLEGAPKTAAGVSGGWQAIIDNLKSLLETGKTIEG
ncbi:MAG TPA: SRPBCC domain-containing protein [Gaiellaceae bacterium]|nr:SRPBCC domain-containing protein [Gaiellaceae bacterium]